MNSMRAWDSDSSSKTVCDYAKPVLEILLVVLGLALKTLALPYINSDVLERFIAGFNILAPLAFGILSVLFVLIPLPMIIPIAAGSLAFGPLWGACYSLIGITAGSCVAFFVGRYFFGSTPFKPKASRVKRIFDKARGAIEQNGFLAMIGLRLVFFTNIVLNYAAGSTGIRFKEYLSGTFLGLVPKLLVFSYVFKALDHPTWSWSMLADPNLILLPALPLSRLGGILLLGFVAKGETKESKRRQRQDVSERKD